MPATSPRVNEPGLQALYEAGDYGRALALIDEEVLAALERSPHDPALAGDALVVANVYRDLARYGAAEAFYLQALAGLSHGGRKGPDHARGLVELAVLYERLDRDGQALELYAAARSIHESAGTDPVGHARCLHNLASALAGRGSRREAVARVRQARQLLESAGAAPVELADLLLDEAHVLGPVEGVVATARMARDGLDLRLRHSGEAHPETAYAQMRVGQMLTALCQFDEAAALLEAARATTARVLGEENPRHAGALEALAMLRLARGDQRRAEEAARRAVAVYRSALGDRSCRAAWAERTLGVVLRGGCRLVAAGECFERALAVLAERYGDGHPWCADLRLELAEVHEASGRRDEAVEMTRAALADLDAHPDDVREDVAGACLALGGLLAGAGEYGEAGTLAARAAALAAEVDNPLISVPALLLRAEAESAGGGQAAPHIVAAERALGRLPRDHLLRNDVDAMRAGLAWVAGDAERAVRLARERVRRAEAGGPRSPWLAPALVFLAEQLHHAGDAAGSEAAYERALELQRRQCGADHPDLAATLRGLARLHLARGNARAAHLRFSQALEIRTDALGERHPLTAESLADLGGLAYQAGDMAAAVDLYRRALDIRDECLGNSHPESAAAAHGLAWAVWGGGDGTRAAELIGERLDLLKPGHPLREPMRHTLALVHHSRGEVARALELLGDVLATRERSEGEASETLVPVLTDLANFHAGLGDQLAARSLLERVLRIHAGSPQSTPLDHAIDRVNLSDCYRNLHDLDRAGALAGEALALARSALPAGDPGLLDFLIHSAMTSRVRGRFRAASRLLAEAAGVVRENGGEGHPRLAGVWVEEAKLEVARGKPRRAIPLLEKAARHLRMTLGEDHADHAAVRQLLGVQLQALGRHAEALPHLRAHLDIVRRGSGGDHPAVALAHLALGELHQQAGDLRAAEEEGRNAVYLVRSSDRPVDANALHGLGTLHRLQGRLAEARVLFEQVLEIDQGMAAGEGLAHLETLHALASVEAATDNPDRALARLRRVLAAQDELVAAHAYLPPGPARDFLLQAPWDLVEQVLTLASQVGCPEAAQAALRWHALSPGDLVPGERAGLRQRHPADADALDRLFDLNRQIACRRQTGAGREGLQIHHDLLARWGAERGRIEEELAGRVPSLARLRVWRAVDADAVRSALPPGGTLVELVRYRPRDFREMCAGRAGQLPARYLALVIRADPGGAAAVDAGPAEVLEGRGGAGGLHALLAPHLAGGGPLVVGTGDRLRRLAGGLGAQVRVVRSGRELASPLLGRQPTGWLGTIRAWLGLSARDGV